MNNIRMSDMTWKMVEEALENGYKTVIVSVGSTEQHGHHLPLSTDELFGDCLALILAEKLRKTLVAPTIRPGCSSHHLTFPGTISVRPETLIEYLKDICISLDHHGFDNIILIPSHGGNFAPVQTTVQSIANNLNANLIALADLTTLISVLKEAIKKTGQPESSVGGHAGAGETSFMLYYKPELVYEEYMKSGYIGPLTGKYVREGFDSVTPTGVLGDPSKGSSEAGEIALEKITDHMVETIKRELAD
ncbi:creatininase family protein [Candidatus Bathyarchaeota archaeon]|nr:creatininase family protein [Candidatus Bathyarchaeota archaeon]